MGLGMLSAISGLIRTGVYCSLSFALMLALTGCSKAPDGSPSAQEPASADSSDAPQAGSVKNLVLICLDTVRADVFHRLSAARNDALRPWENEAVVFKQAHAAGPWTVPSLASVFSGVWPLQHGAGLLPGLYPSINTKAPGIMYEDVPVLARAAADSGFQTAIVSASGWTINKTYSGQMIDGFNEIADFTVSIDKIDNDLWEPMVEKWWALFERDTRKDSALHFLHLMEAHNWHFLDVERLDHRIATLTDENRSLYLNIAPENACDNEDSEICKRYLVYVMAMDYLRGSIAKVLGLLRESGKLESTAVVVFSDHGEEFGDHRDDGRTIPGRPQPTFWGHGRTLYQEQLHVPLMVWHPGYAGVEVNSPVSLIDIAPTAARWLAVDFMPENWGGKFLDDYLVPGATTGGRVIYASSIANGEQQYSAREGDKKTILYLASDTSRYYDLAKDPGEVRSQASDAMVLTFDGYLVDYLDTARKTAIATGALDAAQIKRLQSIGYLQGVDASNPPVSEMQAAPP